MSNLITLIREKTGLNQEELASELNLSRELINKMEGGKTPISHKTKALIEEFAKQKGVNLYSQPIISVENFNSLFDEMLRLKAQVNVLNVTVSEIAAGASGRSIAVVSGELQQASDMEFQRLSAKQKKV